MIKICKVSGCINFQESSGICTMHRMRMHIHRSYDLPIKEKLPPFCKHHGLLQENQIGKTNRKQGWTCKICKDKSRIKDWGNATSLKCATCKEIKKLNEFYKHEKISSSPRCKYCCSRKQKAFRKDNKEHCARQNKEYKSKESAKIKAKETSRKIKLRNFGITPEDYNKKYHDQNGLCAICKKPETAFDTRLKIMKRLSIDHCHTTNKVRGLLCGKCNMGIGLFNDSEILLNNASEYIMAHK